MFKKILLGLLIVVAGLAVVVAMQPAEFRITRSTKVQAPAQVVFDLVNDFHEWEAWSPWAKLDPNAKNTFSGPPSGKGAQFSWVGNDKVGEGSMEILESTPPELIRLKLDFTKPHQSTALTDFAFKQTGETTDVTWSMHGQRNFVEKAVCLVMDMEKMVGGSFEEGLAKMKATAEKKANKTTW